MKPETFRALRSVYYGKASRSEWDDANARVRYLKPATMSEDAWRALECGAYPPNDLRHATHDELIAATLAADAEVSWDEVFEAFVLGCAGTWPRGRQTLISASYARHLEVHPYDRPDATRASDVCLACGLPGRATWDQTDAIFRLYWGYAWNEFPSTHHVDLEERASASPPRLDDAGRLAFRALLRAIDEAPDSEAPNVLAKRLGKEKRLPGTDVYRRYGVLMALGECGVLPNQVAPPSFDAPFSFSARLAAHDRLGRSYRSDIVLPLAGWHGALGVDWERAAELFGEWVRS